MTATFTYKLLLNIFYYFNIYSCVLWQVILFLFLFKLKYFN